MHTRRRRPPWQNGTAADPALLDLPPPAWRLLLAVAGLRLLLHCWSNGAVAYGYMPDELYFFDCAARLDWGYVDHPPLSIALLAAALPVVGDGLLGVRSLAALASAGSVILAGLIARELGGGRAAQGLAAVAELTAPTVLYLGSFYSMNALELVLLAGATWMIARLANGGSPWLWLVLGVCLGLAFLNKWSALWFGAGLGVGLLATSERRWLGTRWPWIAAAIAAALAAPNLLWQVRHGWPTLEFMRRGVEEVMVAKPPLEFLRDQVRGMLPVGALLAVAGLAHLAAGGRRGGRLLLCLWLTVAGILLASGNARPYYLAPMYALVFAAGGVAVERLARRPWWRWLPAALAVLLLLGGAVAGPVVIPLVAPDRLLVYQRAIGFEPPRTEFEDGELPAYFALQFGWPEVADAVAAARRTLPEEERASVGVLTPTFGEAGAVNRFGPALGLPPASGTHNNYWLWGPPAESDVWLVVAAPDAPLLRRFARVTAATRVACRWCVLELQRRVVYVARQPDRPIAELWAEWRDYR